MSVFPRREISLFCLERGDDVETTRDNKGNIKMTEDARSHNFSGKFEKLTLEIEGEREKENLAG